LNGIVDCGAKGVPRGCLTNKLVNPAPRFGFAWDPKGDGKTAIRGGYGIFFEHMNGNEANAEALQAGTSPSVLNGSVANVTGYENIGANAQGPGAPVAPTSTFAIPDHGKWPYVQQWNLGVQHEFPGRVLLSVSYVGSKGSELSFRRDLNQLQPVPAANNPYPAGVPITAQDCNAANWTTNAQGLPTAIPISTGAIATGQAAINLGIACNDNAAAYYRPFQGYGDITYISNGANSIYHALQVGVQRTVGDLTLSFSYTYSHSIDDASDSDDTLSVNGYDPAGNRASSNFDLRHNATISYVYNLPFFKNSQGFKRTLLGGWQASGITVAQSGLPFNVVNGSEFSDNAGVAKSGAFTASRLDLVGDPYQIPAAQQAQAGFGVLALNPAAFELPTGLTFGNVQRNEFRLPGRLNFDFGLFKRFAFKERYAFEFRWETFNVFNHTQLDALGGTVSAGGTGLTTTDGCNVQNAGDPSCAGGGFLVLDGAHNPRIMQFGLRFQF
ncbi:MAG: hypothetical protein ABSG69_13125, partial [Candidatus Acidiferrum sp.]